MADQNSPERVKRIFEQNTTTSGSILFNLTKSGRAVSMKTWTDAMKKAGRKITNLANRRYWFGVNVRELGYEAQYDSDKETIKIVKVGKKKAAKSAKPVAKKAAKKAVKKAAPKARTAAVAVESDSDESSEL